MKSLLLVIYFQITARCCWIEMTFYIWIFEGPKWFIRPKITSVYTMSGKGGCKIVCSCSYVLSRLFKMQSFRNMGCELCHIICHMDVGALCFDEPIISPMGVMLYDLNALHFEWYIVINSYSYKFRFVFIGMVSFHVLFKQFLLLHKSCAVRAGADAKNWTVFFRV